MAAISAHMKASRQSGIDATTPEPAQAAAPLPPLEQCCLLSHSPLRTAKNNRGQAVMPECVNSLWT